MMLSRTWVPTMGRMMDADSGFGVPLLLVVVVVLDDESPHGRFGLLLWLVVVGNVEDDRSMDGKAGPMMIGVVFISLGSKFILLSSV